MYRQLNPKAEKAREKIELIYAVGCHLLGLKMMPSQKKDYPVEKLLAAMKGMNADTLQRAKQFADPVTGYNWQALCAFMRQCRQHDYAPSFSVVARLLAVTKEDRRATQDLLIKNKWGRRDLSTHILTKRVEINPVGRKPKTYVDPNMLLGAIEAACSRWCRWVEYLPSRSSAAYAKLPPEIQKLLLSTTELVSSLGTCASGELSSRYDTQEDDEYAIKDDEDHGHHG